MPRAALVTLCFLLLFVTTIQAAHFCNNLDLTVSGSSPTLLTAASAAAPCAICLAAHGAATAVSKLALSPALAAAAHPVLQPLESGISRTALPYFVRPPPQPISA